MIQKGLEDAKNQEDQAQTLNTEESQLNNDQENDQNLANLQSEENKEAEFVMKESKDVHSQQIVEILEIPNDSEANADENKHLSQGYQTKSQNDLS